MPLICKLLRFVHRQVAVIDLQAHACECRGVDTASISAPNTAWIPCAFEIYYAGYSALGDDTTIRAYFTDNYLVSADSNLLLTAGFIDPNNTGRLKSNDSLYFRNISPSMGGGHSIFYKLKKMSSTVGIKERQRSSTIQIIPNPAQNYIQVSLPGECKLDCVNSFRCDICFQR